MSGFQKIYETDAIVAYHLKRDSPLTLVLFESGGLTGTNIVPQRSFADHTDLSIVTVISHRRNWYPGVHVLPCLAAIREALGDARVVVYGSSMGGYAAIKYSGLLGAEHAIAVAPQFSIDPNVIRLKGDPLVEYFDPDINAGMEITRSDVCCPVDIILDPTHLSDVEHARLIGRRVACRVTHVRHAGHTLERIFSGPSDLPLLIRLLLADDLASVAEMMRRNKRQSVYFHVTLYRALSHRKPAAAEWALRKATALHVKGSSDRLSRCEALSKLGQPQIAAPELEDAYQNATREPIRGALAIALAEALRVMGRGEEAIAWLRLAVEHMPGEERGIIRLVSALTSEGAIDEAEEMLSSFMRGNERPPAHFALSQVRARQGRLDLAAASALRALAVGPANYVWRDHLASVFNRAGRTAEAEALLSGAIQAIGDAGSWFGWSRHLQAAGDLTGALKAARRALKLAPAWLLLRHHLAMLLLELGQSDEAVAISRESIQTWLGGGTALVHLSQLQIRLGQMAEAVASVQQAVADEPAIPGHRAALLDLLIRTNDIDGAVRAAADAETAPCRPNSLFLFAQARLMERQGDIAGAIAAERRAVVLSPDSAAIQGSLARHLLKAGKPGEAEAPARIAVELRSKVEWVHRTLIDALMRTGQAGEAIAACEAAVAAHPSVVDFRVRLAELLQAEKRHAEALVAVESARAAGLETSALAMIEARIRLAAGDAEGAAEAARKAIAFAPDRAGSHDLLARALLSVGNGLEAEQEAREAVRLQSSAVSLRRTLSLVLENQGRIVEAIEACRAALAFASGNHAVLLNAAIKQLEIRQRADAREPQPSAPA